MSGIEVIAQTAIPILSGTSIWASAEKRYRMGFICGLCGQPFWLYSTFDAKQWGMFVLSLWFTIMNVRGLLNHQKAKEVPRCGSTLAEAGAGR